MTQKTTSTVSKHVAGIIPVYGIKTNLNLFFPNAVLPIGNSFYSIQRSIVECSYAGCDTIWIVCSDADAPLIKSICGDFVLNMSDYEHSKYSKFPKSNRRTIPLIYMPISYKHTNKKGLGVSVVDGVNGCFHTSSKISKWMTPSKYYISSPYGVYDPKISKIRTHIMNSDSLFLEYNGRTALDGEHIGFCLGVEQIKHISYLFKRMDVKSHFSLDKILNNDIVLKDMSTVGINHYSNISEWEGYCKMFSNSIVIHPQYKYCFSAGFKKQERKLND